MDESGDRQLKKNLYEEMKKDFKSKLESEEEPKDNSKVDPTTGVQIDGATPGEHGVAEEVKEISIESACEKTLKEIRMKFQPANIYIYPCNRCHEIGQMLHAPTCIHCG